MRVIQKGSDIAHRLMCDTCRSVLEYTSDDVKSACAVIWKYVSCTYGTTMGFRITLNMWFALCVAILSTLIERGCKVCLC